MVYQDYELVATKRVGHARSRGLLLARQQFSAFGGMNTLYMATFFGMAGRTFGATSSTPLSRPLMSTRGLASVARNTVTAAGPVLLGLTIGITSFGNPTEFKNLLRNGLTYRREFKAVQKEHYY